jgi:hypothetical protein
MDPATARGVAHYSHLGQRTRSGRPLIEHVERVAAAVPAEARTVAFLHDVLEWTPTGIEELRAQGLTALELASLRLLTPSPETDHDVHGLDIAYAEGPEGRLARAVKAAALRDHLDYGSPEDRSAAWAYRHITIAQRWWGDPEVPSSRPAARAGAGRPA